MIKSEKLSGIFDFVSIFATATVIVSIAFVFLFKTIDVSGESMCNTLQDKDKIIITAFITEPKRGDIVVTCQPSKYADTGVEPVLVKRVIATGGQTVEIDFDNGIVMVDGEVLDEPYIREITYYNPNRTSSVIGSGYYDDQPNTMTVVVPEGEVFVMGDNRNASTDSRDWRVGTIKEEYILGKALFRAAPFGNFKIG